MPNDQQFFKAAQTGDVKFFTELNEKCGANKSWLSRTYPKSGDTAVHYAAQFGHVNLVKFLVNCGADVEKPNFDGKKPLHEAAQFSQLECVKFLVENGANVDSLKRADW